VHPAALEVADLEVGELSDVVTGQVQRLLAVCNGANVDSHKQAAHLKIADIILPGRRLDRQ
jgi:hypothetical protein